MKYDKRKLSFDDARIHATRCFGSVCSAPCNYSNVWDANKPWFSNGSCPVTDIPDQNIAFASEDVGVRTQEWWKHKFNNVLHLITGYSCNAPCMDGTGCVTQHVERSEAEGNLMDGDPNVLGTPVAIREIEMAFAEWGYEQGLESEFENSRKATIGKKAVVLGSSAAGLTVGIRLLWLGWDVEIVSNVHLGLLMAIPDDHLPYEVAVKPAEQFIAMGGTFTTADVVSSDVKAQAADPSGLMTAAELRSRGDILILCPGTQPRELDVPGAELNGVIQTIPFLVSEKRKRAGLPYDVFELRGSRCLHYGAGDTANDGARTLEFLINDISNVSLAVRSALAEEQKMGWGIPTHSKNWINTSKAIYNAQGNTLVKELIGDQGNLKAAVMFDRKLENTYTVELDHLFLSTGGVISGKPWDEIGVTTDNGILAVDEFGRTAAEGVYACGDAVLRSHRVFPYVIQTANKVVEGITEDVLQLV